MSVLRISISDVAGFKDIKSCTIRELSLSGLKIKSGWLDEAIARGLGFNSYAGLRERMKNALTIVPVHDDCFRTFLLKYATVVDRDLFAVAVSKACLQSDSLTLLDEPSVPENMMDNVYVTLKRFPTSDDLPRSGWVDVEDIMTAMSKNAVEEERPTARANLNNGVVTIDGWQLHADDVQSWLEIKPINPGA